MKFNLLREMGIVGCEDDQIQNLKRETYRNACLTLVQGKLHSIDGIMNYKMHTDILKTNLHGSAHSMGLRNDFIFMHDNNPKHIALNTELVLLHNAPKVLKTPPPVTRDKCSRTFMGRTR